MATKAADLTSQAVARYLLNLPAKDADLLIHRASSHGLQVYADALGIRLPKSARRFQARALSTALADRRIYSDVAIKATIEGRML